MVQGLVAARVIHHSPFPSHQSFVASLFFVLDHQKHNVFIPPKKFAHLRIPHQEIKSATNNFSDANRIRETSFEPAYNGKLLQSGQLVGIIARIWFSRFDDKEDEPFWKEVSMLTTLKHDNLVPIVGFCVDENYMKIIIYKHEGNGNLNKYLKDPTLTWMQRLHICVGVARALSYIYYDEGRDFSVIHHDIRSSKILLDGHWKAKLYGFELSLKQIAAARNRLCATTNPGRPEYADPTSFQSGSVGHKSDMYSFGVLLFEVLTGEESVKDRLLAPLVKSCYKNGRLEDMIDPGLRKQMDPQSLKIFSQTASYCLKEQLSQRPNVHQILIKLTQALDSQRKHENPGSPEVEGTTFKRLKDKNLEHLMIPLTDIVSATNNFATTHLIGAGAFGEVYKGALEHFDHDSEIWLPSEENNVSKFPKKRSTVAIKRILLREDEQGEQGFLAEIKLLTSCRHHNIVSLLGFCKEDSHMILVYEHASNGSLDNYLGITGNLTNLTWVQRIKICIDVARGLNYLHTKADGERKIIHRDIKSGNILLGENWQAKIADFGLSKFRSENNQKENNTLYTQHIAGTPAYLDPEYDKKGKLKNETDIYSFGVVLFEILFGRFANDHIYTNEDSNGLAPVARRRFSEGTIKHMLDPRLMEETGENIFNLSNGPNPKSLDAFIKIAYQCVAVTQAERPTAQVILTKLKEALSYQENTKDNLKIRLEDISRATQKFSDDNLISDERAKVYKGEVTRANRSQPIVVKEFNSKTYDSEQSFVRELRILSGYKHENIIGVVGYCKERSRKIIVTEYASQGSLRKHLNNKCLTWIKRLEISIDIARGLEFLHGGGLTQEVVLHRDINATNILLDDDWKAKISGFTISCKSSIKTNVESDIDGACGYLAYRDPLYKEMGFLTTKSDIYSLGWVLFEILTGIWFRWVKKDDEYDLNPSMKAYYEKGTLHEKVFKSIKQQIAPKSLAAFKMIAYQCLHGDGEKRPTAREVVLKLKKALELQRNHEILEPKLPKDYKEIFQKSNSPDIYSTEGERDLYDLLCKGILLQESKVLFTLGSNGERNEMVSAKTFSYINRSRHKWRHVPSRFPMVVEMLDISNLNIKIKAKAQFLSSDVLYGVYLVFKFCDPRKVSSKPLYVNLKYKNGRRTSHTYFATWRDNEWMMIELCRFLNNKTDIVFKFLLESFSRYYCGDTNIYVEGVEFRAIDNAKGEKIKEQVLKSDQNMDMLQQLPTKLDYDRSDGGEKLFLLSDVDGRTHVMLSAKAALHNSSNTKLFQTKPSTQSSFLEEIQLPQQQVFRINCKIETKMLAPGIDYECYLMFKLSEECCGLQCPVKVRDLRQRKNKEAEVIYFRSPSPWNSYDTIRAPELRKDGWMEVKVLKFNLTHDLKGDSFRVNLKFISYEGTMSGLIVSGLEFRPMFPMVVEMLDISNLNIKIKAKAQFLSSDVLYGVYLVFKFCDPRKVSSKPLYVNLKYKNGRRTSHTYFATWRDNEWMMIELCRFLNNKTDIVFKFLLESFSRYYCGDTNIYVEGVEFRAIDNAKGEKIKEQVLKSDQNMDMLQQLPTKLDYDRSDGGEKLFLLSDVDGRTHVMLSAKAALHNSSNTKLFQTKPSTQSSFLEEIQLPQQQVFRINCKIETKMLAPGIDYECYLMFKLSEECCGLQCPVKVRDLRQRKNKEAEVIYFRSPSPWNSYDTIRAPELRKDGWMEVKVLKFNLTHDLKGDSFRVNLKFISYEGTMSGLIVSGLEFRPM